VLMLRARQFREDAGPLAHPVRPESFVEINNFYTATVYEKGAELIGMLKRLVGEEGYARALDHYFAQNDGRAATIEDWLGAFEVTTGRDLTQFKRWYSEAGTPRLKVREEWEAGTLTLHLAQENPPTPGQPDKAPKVIPVAVGLLSPNGDEVLPTTVLELTEAHQSFRFEGLGARPVVSILRGFSAPVVLERAVAPTERAFLLAHDTDPFNKWEAGRALARDVLSDMILGDAEVPAIWTEALASVVLDQALDPAFRALALRLPGEEEMAQALHAMGHVPDPDSIYAARRRMGDVLARHLAPSLPGLMADLAEPGPFSAGARAAGRRALRVAALGVLSRVDGGEAARAAFARAGTMTEELGALSALLDIGAADEALASFEARWSKDASVMDKWFSLQVLQAPPAAMAKVARRLVSRRDFRWQNPNRFRAVMGAVSGNHAGFHRADGSGYDFLADWLIRLDPLNPQTAARMSTAFETAPRLDAVRQAACRAALTRILAQPGLSRDLGEMAGRLMG
jgi:aminopeptidase N